MLKYSGLTLDDAMAILFTDVLQNTGTAPKQWKETRLRVLFKKGDASNPQKYRPIAILPTLLKLFSRELIARISDVLERAQSRDQAGFRRGFGCEYHLSTVTMLHEEM